MPRQPLYYFRENVNNLIRYWGLAENKNEKVNDVKIPQKKIYFYYLILAILTTLVYSNHFNNCFHFDDSHTIVNNIYIQNVKNIPLFFKDGTTFSSLPANQSYRPVVTATLAIDYWLGGGLNSFYFHLSQFIFFLLQGLLMFFLFLKIFSLSFPHRWNFFIALFSVALYLLHPANAETINYIIARTDSISTFFLVLAFVMYAYSSFCRKTFLYLIPVLIGAMAKETAIMFAPLLFIYILLFEKKISFTDIFSKESFSKLLSAFFSCLPVFIFCLAAYFFQQHMQSETWTPGGTSRYLYGITQPYVILHYFKTFFIPSSLSADTDWIAFDSIWNFRAILGFIFVSLLFLIGILTSRYEKTRPISFGIFWFFIALVPTSSLIPLSEVMNDHRIFFPYIGLAISICWILFLIVERWMEKKSDDKKIISGMLIFSFLILSAYAFGTHERNKVWRTEETLWRDVTIKSPNNARGLMNYGLVLMAKADYKGAEKYFTDAIKIWPYYAYLHINMGILKSATGFPQEAEQYFNSAIIYRNDVPDGYYYYAKFLYEKKRINESIAMLNKTLALTKGYTLARYLLMAIYFDQNEFEKLREIIYETLELIPTDSQAQYYLHAIEGKKSKLDVAIEIPKNNPTPENYIQLSLEYYNAGKYDECINACKEALILKPDFDLAYNNICSAYNQLGNWDKAIEAGKKAILLNPNNQLAKNNLQVAIQSKKK